MVKGLDLTAPKAAGKEVDTRSIRKHGNNDLPLAQTELRKRGVDGVRRAALIRRCRVRS